MVAESKFPKPWRAENCGDSYRVFDANGRQLFVIGGDEYDAYEGEAGDSDGMIRTVFFFGGEKDDRALREEIERLFPGRDAEQAWLDEVQYIVCTFVQNDHELGELMLDHSERYWNHCFNEGLTPQEALDGFLKRGGAP